MLLPRQARAWLFNGLVRSPLARFGGFPVFCAQDLQRAGGPSPRGPWAVRRRAPHAPPPRQTDGTSHTPHLRQRRQDSRRLLPLHKPALQRPQHQRLTVHLGEPNTAQRGRWRHPIEVLHEDGQGRAFRLVGQRRPGGAVAGRLVGRAVCGNIGPWPRGGFSGLRRCCQRHAWPRPAPVAAV